MASEEGERKRAVCCLGKTERVDTTLIYNGLAGRLQSTASEICFRDCVISDKQTRGSRQAVRVQFFSQCNDFIAVGFTSGKKLPSTSLYFGIIEPPRYGVLQLTDGARRHFLSLSHKIDRRVVVVVWSV